MRSAKLGLLVVIGTVALVGGKLNLQPSTAQAQTNANSLQIVSGAGQITRSQYPNFVAVGTRVDQVAGVYDPASRQIVMKVQGRRAELSLNSPLTEDVPVAFRVTRFLTRGQVGGDNMEPSDNPIDLVQNVVIDAAIESQGTLVKKGNQIVGQFTSRGKFEHEGQEGNGTVAGEFVLNVQSGGANMMPQQRIQSPPSSNSPELLW